MSVLILKPFQSYVNCFGDRGVYRIRREACKCSHLHLYICLYVCIELGAQNSILSSKGVKSE